MRKSILLASFLVAAALGVGLYLSHAGRRASAQAITLDRSLVALLPANATTLVGVDVERLKRTPVYQDLEQQSESQASPARNHFDEFVAATGFDPRRDVQALLVASWPPPAAASGAPAAGPGANFVPPQWVAVARGSFNVSALSSQLRDKKVFVENYRGVDVFEPNRESQSPPRPHPPRAMGQNPRQPGGFAFLDDKTAVAGTLPSVLAAIDRKLGGGPSLQANTALLARAETISAASQVWVVSQNPGEVITRALPKNGSAESSNFARIFSGLQNSTFALDLMNGLNLKADGLCRTAEDAKTLGDAARGFVAIGRLAVSQKQPELMVVFDGIHVEENNAALNISVQVDLTTFEKLLDRARSQKKVRDVNFSR
ncbi:MAG TPA: hypothetical protein VEU62_20690 [Bryobacterales bacterium]|nr:hypothetical protein [Bryobacterales bacterium]